MRSGGFFLGMRRRAKQATAIACGSHQASQAGKTSHRGSNSALAQRALRAAERKWFEGRIAGCPRLQHIGRRLT